MGCIAINRDPRFVPVTGTNSAHNRQKLVSSLDLRAHELGGRLMKFGIFDHMDRSGAPFGEQYESRLQLIEAYDRGGFYAYHVAEHHGTPLGYSPSPSVFLAAVGPTYQE